MKTLNYCSYLVNVLQDCESSYLIIEIQVYSIFKGKLELLKTQTKATYFWLRNVKWFSVFIYFINTLDVVNLRKA